MKLAFVKAKTESDYNAIFQYNIDAFSDSPDFQWNLEEIKAEVKDGWELYSANLGEEVVAALFVKRDGQGLFSKHTSIKQNHQGSGYSHMIKNFIEELAKDNGAKEIYNYCRIDNFRQYSLNESHGYVKTNKKVGKDNLVVEWIKKI
ncbi:acetyltransferase, GNAT family [Bacteriovorax sp. BSW11_IV]|uniref:GNAT family N-acetyltransferase n=1 Tax=Bacteriovorax sp. BSW11_IV TaxID=1353529 RepID=UPI00038A0D5D|nr:GNAT family N-acetyltransferase [Bacteriovorax sp. BSW11_IV]EQC47657.1 acetyltransferase, GNAT family [Bacteriovorax sp. BSW11_IV]